MDIKLAECCGNCEFLLNGQLCSKHQKIVSRNQVCGAYEFRAVLRRDSDCLQCRKFETDECAHPAKAGPGMLCTAWSPRASA